MGSSYLSIKQVAEQLGVEYKTVYRLIRKGELPAAKIGGVYRLRPGDVDAYVEQQIQLTRQEALRDQELAPAPDLRCERCLRLIRRDEDIGGACQHPGCEKLLCALCWEQGDGRFCRHHQPGPAEKLAQARAARAAGEIPVLVTAVEARRRELNFRDRFDRKIRALPELPHPAGPPPLRVSHWEALGRPGDQAFRLAELLGEGRLEPGRLESLPVNLRSRYTLPAGRGRPALVVEAQSLSHQAAHVRDGFDTQPVTLEELLPLLSACAAEAEREGHMIVVGLAATTGWAPEAAALVAGRARGQAWAHRLVFPTLVDLEKLDTAQAAGPPWRECYRQLFALPLPEEEVAAVQEFVLRNLTLQSSLSGAEIREALGVSPGAVLTAFQRLVSQGGFLIEEIPGVGRVIARL